MIFQYAKCAKYRYNQIVPQMPDLRSYHHKAVIFSQVTKETYAVTFPQVAKIFIGEVVFPEVANNLGILRFYFSAQGLLL